MEQREQVEWFSFEMEEVLRQNDHKKGLFDDMALHNLLQRLQGEVKELEAVIDAIETYVNILRDTGYIEPESLTEEEKAVIKKEAVDVANFAMAIAWRVR